MELTIGKVYLLHGEYRGRYLGREVDGGYVFDLEGGHHYIPYDENDEAKLTTGEDVTGMVGFRDVKGSVVEIETHQI